MKKEKEEREKKQKALQKAAEEKAAKAPQVCYLQRLYCYLLQSVIDNSAIFVEGRRDRTRGRSLSKSHGPSPSGAGGP